MSKKTVKHRLSIAFLGHKRIPSCEGGIEVVVQELTTRMAAKGHRVTCYNRKKPKVAGEQPLHEQRIRLRSYKGVCLKEVFTINRRGLAAMSSSFFATVHAALGRYDVVHIHAEGPAAFCFLPKLFGKKVIVTIHGLDHQRAKWGRLASAYILLGEKNAVRFADEIIVLSQGVQTYFLKNYGRKTRFIPNGVNQPEIREADEIRKLWGLKKDGYILYLGRLVPEKGEQYLIEAFKQVCTDKNLVIAGGSSDTDEFTKELRRMAADDPRILFTGFVQGSRKDELYSNPYIYTLPSDLEGMPLSLLEAMSYGNCCLTSDIAECAEVVEDKAVLFKKSNVEDLREKLQYLCDHPETVQYFKEQAAPFILGKYNWDKVTRQTLALYRTTLK